MRKSKISIGYRVTWISVIANVILFTIKYYVGTEINSIALIADAWHSLSDTLTSFVVIVGLWISTIPPDHEHPYGHGRAEYIAAIVVATLLGMVAFEIFTDSLIRIGGDIKVEYGSTAIIVLIITILVKEILAQISIYYGKKHRSESLKADGWHHRSDSISSAVILVGILFGGKFYWMDGAMGIIVSLLLIYAMIQIFRSSTSALLGEQLPKERIEEVIKIANNAHPEVSDIHNIKIHTYGDHKEMSFDMRLPSEISVSTAHDIATDVEKIIYKKFKIRSTAHIEPEKKISV